MALKHNMHFCKDCKEIFLSKVHDCLAKKRKVFTCELEGCNGKNFKLYSFYLNHMMKTHGVKRDDEMARTIERINIENGKEKNKSIKISSFRDC